MIARYSVRSEKSPHVEHVSLVAPDVLSVEILTGKVIPGSVVKYVAKEGDKIEESKRPDGSIREIIVRRDGKRYGRLIGPERDWIAIMEGFEGDPLIEFLADDAANYTLTTDGGPVIKPLSVSRKSKAYDWAQDVNEFAIRHTLFLKLPTPLSTGTAYSLDVGKINTREQKTGFTIDPTTTRSDAVHVNQVGYRPDDSVKRAFYSCWLGTGGALTLPEVIPFSIVDDASGEIVFSGKGERHFPAERVEKMARTANFNATDVARFDFSAFDKPGRYRVIVDGVGCSYPFDIARDVWEKAFRVKMRGLYNQRSGMELSPPFADYTKPLDLHPDAGTKTTHSTFRAIDGGNANYSALAAADTGKPAPNAWGGYHDAGDWNPRRVTHLAVSMAQLEIFDLFPDKFSKMDLPIPAVDKLPDLLAEALWEFDCFLRLQQEDGGMPFGIETNGDPLPGEVSWLQSMQQYVYAPDYYASWYYAGAAARFARILAPYDSELAEKYRVSALKAFAWGQKDFKATQASGVAKKARALAAVELYRLTREEVFPDLFKAVTFLNKEDPLGHGRNLLYDSYFAYTSLPEEMADLALKAKAIAAIKALGDRTWPTPRKTPSTSPPATSTSPSSSATTPQPMLSMSPVPIT